MKLSKEQIIRNLRDIIEFNFNIDLKGFHESVELFDNGIGLNSLQIIKLLTIISKQYDIKIKSNIISKNKFSNLDKISDFIIEEGMK